MREVSLAYGKGSLRVGVPEGLAPPDAFPGARAPAPLAPRALYREAVSALPPDLPGPIAVVVPDGTRPAARADALAALAPRVTDRLCTVVVGGGLHAAAPIDAPWPCRAACAQPRPEPADAVVADAGGHPADRTLLQAHKAYDAAFRLLRPGGTIVLVAKCDGGFGHREFERRLRGGTGPFHPYAETAERWREKARAARTVMVTDLDTDGLGVARAGAQAAVDAIPRGARVLWAPAAQELWFE